jgi:hypothetical protein
MTIPKARKVSKEIAREKQAAATSAGNIVNGDRSERFQAFVKKHFGMDKQEFLSQLETRDSSMQENLYRKVQGLTLWNNHIVGALSEYYKQVSSTGLSLQNDLIVLEADLVSRRLKMEELDPNYDPLEDEVYQAGLDRKSRMLQQMARINIDVQRLKRDMDKDTVKKVNGSDSSSVIDMVIDDDSED